MARPRGQLLVELAIAIPLILFVILGAVEMGFLLIAKAGQDRSTAVVAEWAAEHPGESWNSVASRELEGCDVTVEAVLPDLLEATSRCQYHPVVLVMFSALPVSSRETAATTPSPAPSTSPVGSPSS